MKNKYICPKCKKIMRKWFDRQEHSGFGCDECGYFIKNKEQ